MVLPLYGGDAQRAERVCYYENFGDWMQWATG